MSLQLRRELNELEVLKIAYTGSMKYEDDEKLRKINRRIKEIKTTSGDFSKNRRS